MNVPSAHADDTAGQRASAAGPVDGGEEASAKEETGAPPAAGEVAPNSMVADDTPERQQQPPVDRRLLDRIFGDVLPEVTRDEQGLGGSGRGEDWYRENRPPHHGG